MTNTTKLIVIFLVSALFIVFMLVVWPTPYRYDHISLGPKTYPVRVNRFTGTVEKLGFNGWTKTSSMFKPENTSELVVSPPFQAPMTSASVMR